MGINANSDIVTVSFPDIEFSELLDNLVKETQLKNYRVTKIVNVDNIGMRENLVKDLKIGFKHYKIVEICNLFNCNDLISADLRAGVFMPVRFAVYQASAKEPVRVSYLKPTAFASLFDSKKMMETANKLGKDMEAIIEEAGF